MLWGGEQHPASTHKIKTMTLPMFSLCRVVCPAITAMARPALATLSHVRQRPLTRKQASMTGHSRNWPNRTKDQPEKKGEHRETPRRALKALRPQQRLHQNGRFATVGLTGDLPNAAPVGGANASQDLLGTLHIHLQKADLSDALSAQEMGQRGYSAIQRVLPHEEVFSNAGARVRVRSPGTGRARATAGVRVSGRVGLGVRDTARTSAIPKAGARAGDPVRRSAAFGPRLSGREC